MDVNCAKSAEVIEMQFGMLSWVDPGNMYYMGHVLHGDVDVPVGRGTLVSV